MPEHWPQVLRAITEHTGAQRGLLFTPRVGMREGGLWYSYQFAHDDLQSYDEYYCQIDPWAERTFQDGITPGRVVDVDRLVARDTLEQSEFYNDYLRKVDIERAMAALLEGPDGSYPRVHLSVFRPRGTALFTTESERWMQSLVPHLHRALELGFRFMALHNRNHAKLEALHRLDFAVAGLYRDGRISFMNQRAEETVAARDGLGVRAQHIVASNHVDHQNLWALVQDNLAARRRGTTAPGGSVRIRRPSNRRDYVVTVVPGAVLPAVAGTAAAWVLVYITDPDRPAGLPATRAADIYGLTGAEAQLAVALTDGKTLTEYARESDLSLHTVRSTLKQIFAKTDTSRQVDLVRLLLTTVAIE